MQQRKRHADHDALLLQNRINLLRKEEAKASLITVECKIAAAATKLMGNLIIARKVAEATEYKQQMKILRALELYPSFCTSRMEKGG